MRSVSSFWASRMWAAGVLGLAVLISSVAVNAATPDEKAKRDDPKTSAKAAPIDFTAGAPKVPEAVRSLLQDRKYAEAVKAIEQASTEPGAAKDYLLFLKGRALH